MISLRDTGTSPSPALLKYASGILDIVKDETGESN